MPDPLFLDVPQVLRIHQSLIVTYGGASGVRELGLLQSAVAMPQASFGDKWLHGDLFEMAAAYLFHIVQNHPFVDGNKRTGAAAAIIFLALNDVDLAADEDGLVEITLGVASHQREKNEVAEFFRLLGRVPPDEQS